VTPVMNARGMGVSSGRATTARAPSSYGAGPSLTSMIRVAYDTGPLHGPRTGIGVAVEQLSLALAASSPDVELHPYLLSFRATIRPGTTRLRYPAAVALRTWARFGTPRPDRRLGDVDVVHGTNYVVPPSRRPRLVSVYDCWALDNPRLVHADVRAAMRVLRRSIADGAFVHASSHATAERLRDLVPGCDVTVIHLGDLTTSAVSSTDGAVIPPRLLGGVPFVLAVGTRERRKNLPTLVRAFADLASRHPEVHLVLAGGPGDDDAIIDQAVSRLESNIEHRVHLLGRVSEPTAKWLLEHSSLLAYPSLDEGFGFPLLEAMAHRTPIVASNVGSIPEVVGSAAVLVDPRDTDAWAEAISDVLTDASLAARLVTAGDVRRQDFTWEKTGRLLHDLYRRVVASAP